MILMLGAVHFGYTMGYSTSVHVFEDFKNFSDLPTFERIASWTAVPSPIITGVALHYVGRRKLLIIYALCGMLIWLLSFTAKANYHLAYVFRGLGGVSIGAFSALTPLYMVELAPPSSAGFFGTLNQLGIAIGFLLCYVIGSVSELEATTAVAAVWPGLLAALASFLPESPAAQEAQTPTAPHDIRDQLFTRRWMWELFRWGILMFFQQATGINPFILNLTNILGAKGGADLQGLALGSVAQVIACLIGAFLIERVGQRAIWTVSLAGASLTNLLFTITQATLLHGTESEGSEVITIPIIFAFLLSYGLGAGPIPWLVVPEFVPPRLRAVAMTVIACLNWSFAAVVISVIQPLTQSGAMWAHIFFTIASLGGAIFGFFYVWNPAVRESLHPDIYDDLVSQ
jgi:MFS family permease